MNRSGKEQQRAEAKQRRAELARDGLHHGAAAPQALRDNVLAGLLARIDLPAGTCISGYWPLGDELDLRPLLLALHDLGHPLCLPVVTGSGAPLIFRSWKPGDSLVPASFATQVPAESQAEITPSLLLVPLLAFDRDGNRLGYGGGFYDRTLAKLRADKATLAVGIAYAGQEVPRVHHDSGDETLDWLVTEAEVIKIGIN